MEGEADEGKDPVREFPRALQEVVISLPADSGVLPGKTADHAPVHILTVHGLQQVREPGQAGFFAAIKDPETFIPGTKIFSFLPDLVREEVGMGIDDHRVGSDPPKG
jgi:hypothetical protein